MGPISILTNTDSDFYSLMGQFLSRREIVTELGAPLWDDDGKVWFVAQRDGCVIGFAALTFHGKAATFCSAYVLPEHRKSGVHTELLEYRIAFCRERGIERGVTVAKAAAVAQLQKAGFVSKATTKNYTRMELTL
jgi:GNAT superfamily N-acetyltransferase